MADDFDPADPPRPAPGNLLAEYQRPPGGLVLVAVLQMALAVALAALVTRGLGGSGASAAAWARHGIAPALFAASSVGMFLRRGWGWWLTCAIYSAVFFNVPVSLVLWTLDRLQFAVLVQLLLFTAAVLIVAYLNRAGTLRFVRFSSADGRPSRTARSTPALAGALAALIRLAAELV